MVAYGLSVCRARIRCRPCSESLGLPAPHEQALWHTPGAALAAPLQRAAEHRRAPPIENSVRIEQAYYMSCFSTAVTLPSGSISCSTNPSLAYSMRATSLSFW
jgi:hypothetical protein